MCKISKESVQYVEHSYDKIKKNAKKNTSPPLKDVWHVQFQPIVWFDRNFSILWFKNNLKKTTHIKEVQKFILDNNNDEKLSTNW